VSMPVQIQCADIAPTRGKPQNSHDTSIQLHSLKPAGTPATRVCQRLSWGLCRWQLSTGSSSGPAQHTGHSKPLAHKQGLHHRRHCQQCHTFTNLHYLPQQGVTPVATCTYSDAGYVNTVFLKKGTVRIVSSSRATHLQCS
jgi:hypothetical protein